MNGRDRYLFAEEVAQIVGQKPDTIRTWARQGRIPGGIKSGKRWMFSEQRLYEFLSGLAEKGGRI